MSDNVIAKLVKSYQESKAIFEKAYAYSLTQFEEIYKGPEEAKQAQRDKILESMSEALELDRYLLLAAAELWLRRRGKFPSDAFWERYDGECKCHYMLPSVIFDKMREVNKLQLSVGYGNRETAWTAAIEAVAKYLAEGTIKDE